MRSEPFKLREIAIPAFGPSFLFGLGEGAILPIIPLSVRQLGGSVALAALTVTLIGIGSLLSNLPASIITARWGERWAIVGAALWSALGMLLCVLTGSVAWFAVGILMIGMSSAVLKLARRIVDAVHGCRHDVDALHRRRHHVVARRAADRLRQWHQLRHA
ncbi:MAG: MFS transporter, partial [Casimicrobiaceae bacterium]